jgi:hypothetical protein
LGLAPVEDGNVVPPRGEPVDLATLGGLEPDRARRVVDHQLVLGEALAVQDDHPGEAAAQVHFDVVLRSGETARRRCDLIDVTVDRLLPLVGRVGVVAEDE